MATHPELYPTFPPLGLWIRLPVQGLLVLWAYWYTRRAPATSEPSGSGPRS